MTDSKRIDVAELARKIAEQLLEYARTMEKQKQLAGDNRRPMH